MDRVSFFAGAEQADLVIDAYASGRCGGARSERVGETRIS
jgi:hypothetical protein